MLIENRANLSFTVSDKVGDTTITEIVFTDADTLESLGTLSISKENSQAFVNALDTILREVHDVFQVNKKHATRFDNLASGTISFRD